MFLGSRLHFKTITSTQNLEVHLCIHHNEEMLTQLCSTYRPSSEIETLSKQKCYIQTYLYSTKF
ncbi:hypothetical protein X975_18133, partial [Stegodyphus mimosarum]